MSKEGNTLMAMAMAYPEGTKGGRGRKIESPRFNFSHDRLVKARFILRQDPELAHSAPYPEPVGVGHGFNDMVRHGEHHD